MLTRETIGSDYRAGCQGAPPPLHVYSPDNVHAAWHPLQRPVMHPHPPGPDMVTIPGPPGQTLGDDPTDPGGQTLPRAASAGMIARLNLGPARRSAVAAGGVRL